MDKPNVTRLFALLPLLLLLLLPACSTRSTPSVIACPVLPPMPSVTQPQPSPTYLESAKTDIEAWLKKLIGTQAIPAP